MKYFIYTTIILLLSIRLFSQEVAPNKYYIEFTDKDNNGYEISNPESFLSQRSLMRRAKQNIGISFSDLPVTKAYTDSIIKLGVQIINTSKWFNSALIYTEDLNKYNEILELSFVKSTPDYNPVIDNTISYQLPNIYKDILKAEKSDEMDILVEYDYGQSERQIKSTNTHKLHEAGFRGQNMLIAVIDAGFKNTEQLSSLEHLYTANKVISTKEFITGQNNPIFYSSHDHGTKVFSIIGAFQQGELIGSAPESDFALLVSEDNDYENYIEEINWISAAEYADSLGADILNVSLGYVFFDMATYNHSYETLDGKHAISSKAVTHAASKGIISAVAMGNSGSSANHPWLGAPADGENILGVGAIDQALSYAGFSSIGPSSDGRIKPDVVAIGQETYFQDSDHFIKQGNGTSFATPLISGMLACLWQKHPEKNNLEIMDAVRKSANLYNYPTAQLGYGLPDFAYASEILSSSSIISNNKEDKINISPNPFETSISISIDLNTEDNIEIQIFDIMGKEVYHSKHKNLSKGKHTINIDNLEILKQSVFLVRINTKDNTFTKRLFRKSI